MQIHLFQNGQQSGPYSLEDIRARLANGTLQPSDLAWYEGAADWAPVSSVPGVVVNAPLPPSTPPPFAPRPQTYAAPMAQSRPAPETAGLALTSMVLGLLGIILSILTALPAIICGHVALSRIRKSGGSLKGEGFAITGLVTGYLFGVVSFVGILAGIALPVFMAVQQKGLAIKSLSNAKQIAISCKLYAADHNGDFPPTLRDLVPMYVKDPAIFVDPLDPTHPADGYEYFGGKDSDPADKILIQSKVANHNMRVIVHCDGSGLVQREHTGARDGP